jgi:AraC-like DNA-binding protein
MRETVLGSCRVVAWQPPVPGISEVFHAHIVDYRYPSHYHDTWALLIVDDGAIRYGIDTRERLAFGESITLLPPGIIHDGYPSEQVGEFRKRELYLDVDFLPADLVGPAVDSSTFHDRGLRAALSRLHDRLAASDTLEVEAMLAMVSERLRRHLQPRTPPPAAPEPTVARQLRGLLDEHVTAGIRLADAALVLGRTVPHLVRSFKRQFGITPHAYLTSARIERARRLLLQGQPPSHVAVEVGFHDQAHFNRHFKRHVSVPPACYAASNAKVG